MINNTSTKQKSKLSPNEKFLKSFYSKQKSKSEYSPNGYRSISKEQIKHEIKKIVYASTKEEALQTRYAPPKNNQYRDNHIHQQINQNKMNIRTSLTPKSFHYPKKQSDRQVHSTKAGDAKNKDLFTSSGRYDLKQLFEKKKDRNQDSIRIADRSAKDRDRQRVSGRKKQNNYVDQRMNEETTIKFNQRDRDDHFNVSAYLTPDQYNKFGERFPQKFKRIGLLGRGGFSVVWLGVHRSSKRKVAIKQILTKNPHETHLKQIWFGSYFFEKGGQARQQFENHMGINNICKLYSHEIRSLDSWLYYQVCDESLGSSIFELKGQTLNGERMYKIQYKELIYRIRDNPLELKILIIEVSKALMLINSHNIVHSDLKTENILVKTRKKQDYTQKQDAHQKQDTHQPFIQSLKLIDFGSSFLFTNLKQFSMATPQYMPPEILNYILFQNKLEYDKEMLGKMEKYKNAWVIDVWSLGCIILQIISGVPLWMSIDTKIEDTNIKVTGLYAVKNRVFGKIIMKQIEVVSNLDYYLDNCNYSGIMVSQDVRRILKKMLSLNPDERVSPFEILTQCGVDCQPERIPSY